MSRPAARRSPLAAAPAHPPALLAHRSLFTRARSLARSLAQVGDFKIHDYLGSSWGIVFSHPKDYTPVCTTELGEAALQEAEFTKRGVKMIALSCDSVEDHKGWVADIEAARGAKVTYPIISDPRRETAQLLGMLDEDEKDAPGIPATVRKVFLIGPDKKVKLQLIYPTAVGRNFAEILRCIDALQLAATHPIATPVNWQRGQDVMIQPSVSDDKAAELFPGFKRTAVPSGKGCVLCARAQASERANAQAARACSQASVLAIERARSRARPARASGVRLARARARERERGAFVGTPGRL